MSNPNQIMQYTGTEMLYKINSETGEFEEIGQADMFFKPLGRNEPFMITYLAEIINLIDNLGNKKMKVVKYILNNMSKSDNILLTTNRELASKAGVGINTVTETLKVLEKANIIQRRTGAIMISPKLLNNKKAKGEAIMMTKYKQFSE
ncbi:replication/maintenance protein RepL [Clostridium perfringens]|uniref:replication/maintenance protein RepL n=1 Tax=Clostridium perfringens TaxID=1502 RepID=UPI001B845511|nr:replication/maintenance protein RepL [Clostridium perfringens]HBC2035118.1 replication/maintenance protein RepL [Clostridium perfringens]HBC2058262.1 replication/maintenance protein RepL [Clostridium perfringens]HBC2072472.1 replication/maintenance protein RepL [Clostridium perfringens]